jgi:vacuolar-type H+-ATPase subunit H
MSTSALGRAEKGGLRKISKATTLMDRRINHARQLFNERIARAESEYFEAYRRAYEELAQMREDTPSVQSVSEPAPVQADTQPAA